jgi:hypothetical protein
MSGLPIDARFPGLKIIVLAAALAFTGTAHTGTAQAQRAGPFSGLAGSWAGGGSIAIGNGVSERIRCLADYHVANTGTTVTLQLRCASDSYKFELASDVTYDGGNISGSWNETTRSVYGQLTGRVTGTNITAQASAVGFSASLSIATRGNSQNVSIRSPGSEISEVTVSMTRAGR